jgi:hypothetical protein
MDMHGSDTSLPPSRSSGSDLAREMRSQVRQATNTDNQIVSDSGYNARPSNGAHKAALKDVGGRVTRYNMSSFIDWKAQSQIEVRLSNVPHNFTTWEVYRLVEGYGNIVKISIPDKPYKKNKVAYVKFQ